jgi:hypothetical protein
MAAVACGSEWQRVWFGARLTLAFSMAERPSTRDRMRVCSSSWPSSFRSLVGAPVPSRAMMSFF